jgi:hypothetical protein
MNTWLHQPIPIDGDLMRVPGIGPKHKEHFMSCKDGKTCIKNIWCLFGFYLSIKEEGVSSIEHNERFFVWLKENQGIKDHRHSIVEAVASRMEMHFPGFYDAKYYMDQK